MSLIAYEMMTLLEFCLNTVFTFDGKVYQQVKGTPMGSPISGVIDEALLQRLEQEVLPRCPPKFWERYVDVLLLLLLKETELTCSGIS